MQATTRVVVALERLKSLYLEVPETKLSLFDAARIAELDQHVCRQLMAALVDVRFLRIRPTADTGGVVRSMLMARSRRRREIRRWLLAAAWRLMPVRWMVDA